MLNRWDPFTEIARLHDELARNFGGSRDAVPNKSSYSPAVDILEDKESVFVKIEVPGVKPQDAHVSVENDVLTLTGERKSDFPESREGVLRVERPWGKFSRSFSLPKTVDGDRIDAELADGVLTVRIPKRQAPQPKRIEVRSVGVRAT